MREALKNLSPRTFQLSGWSVILLALVAGVMYGFLPRWRDYQKSAALQSVLSEYAAGDTDLAQQIAKHSLENEALKQRLLGDIGRLPPKQLQAYVIGKLQALSWQTGMEMVAIKPAAEGKVENFRALEFEVELTGDFFDWFAWMKKMRDDLGFITVQGYDIRTLNLTEANPNLGITLKITAYRAAEVP
jgi:hypothetical protein